MVSYHHLQYYKKTNDPILRKLSDRETEGQTDQSDFIGCCRTNVEHPKMFLLLQLNAFLKQNLSSDCQSFMISFKVPLCLFWSTFLV